MKRYFPYPVTWVLLLGSWLLLNQTLAAAHVILGAIVAFGAIHALGLLDPPAAALRRPAALLQLTGLVLADVVRSNLAVARIVVHPTTRTRTSGFVQIPLDLRHPAGLAALACIITATPGTSWARYDSARAMLTMHVLDLVDEEAWVRTIKDRYERRLREIFE